MTLPEHDNSLSQRDRLPPNERGQDEERTEISRGLTMEQARPMTADERHAAETDTPLAERVYAPASERVPKEPVAGHRTFVEHPDDSTPERQAVAEAEEPSFTRVDRPSSVETQRSWSPPPMSSPYSSNTYYPAYEAAGSRKPDWHRDRRRRDLECSNRRMGVCALAARTQQADQSLPPSGQADRVRDAQPGARAGTSYRAVGWAWRRRSRRLRW